MTKFATIQERLKFSFLVATVLISISLWSFQLIPEAVWNILEAVVIVSLIGIVLFHHLVLRRKLIFKTNIYLFMIIPAISAFGAFAFHGQPLLLSFLLLRVCFLWLLYFVLHLFNFSTERILQLIITVGVVWASLTILQQLTYPHYYFSSKEESDDYSIYRGGVYRFMVAGQQYGAFFLFYYFYQYLTLRKANALGFVLLGLLGFYCYGTRQFAVAAMACLVIAVLMVKGRAQLTAISLLIVGVPLLIAFSDRLFAQYIEMTNEQFQYGDNVRQLAAQFWLNEYWPDSWLAKLTGNGPPHKLSAYGQEIEFIRAYNHFYRSDVGVIGAFNEFGILYALNILWVNLRGIQSRFFTRHSRFLRLLFFYALILMVTSQYYSKSIGIPFFCMIFYLIDKSYEEKKEAIGQ